MLGSSPNQSQTDLFKSLLSHQLNPQHPFYLLARAIPWKKLKEPSLRSMGAWAYRWGPPCAASDLVHFRHRLGEEGIAKLFALSVVLHEDKG